MVWLLAEPTICNVKNEVTGGKMCPAIVSGIVTWTAIGQFFAWPWWQLTVPEFFAKNNSPQFPGDFHSKYDSIYHILPDWPCVCFQPAVLL